MSAINKSVRRLSDTATATAIEGLQHAVAYNQTPGNAVWSKVMLIWVGPYSDGRVQRYRLDGWAGKSLTANVERIVRVMECKHFHVVEPVRPIDGECEISTLIEAFDANPWLGSPYFRENIDRWAEHGARPSNTIEGMLAYYASPAHRAAERLSVIKPGRYLRKFFGDLMDDGTIEVLAQRWSNEFAPRPLIVTQDADEIENVYRKGPSSCMTFRHGGYDGECHPARVYAGPDLAVAYIGDENEADGRAVVWPDKKIFGRTYGDNARMEAALKLAGYREAKSGEFDRARLQRFEGREGIVCPYLDMVGQVDDNGTHLIITPHGDYEARGADGVIDSLRGGRTVCAHCEDRYDDEDEGSYVEGVGSVCDYCLEHHYFHCGIGEEYSPMNERANTRCGSWVSETAVSRSGNWFLCEGNDEWVRCSDDGAIVMDDGRTVSETWAETNAFRCVYSDEWVEAHGSNSLILTNGEAIDRNAFSSERLMVLWLADEGHTVEAYQSGCGDLNEQIADILADRAAQLELELAA
jgi:hypothetical protein